MKHTDQQINIALAKAIGYRDEDIISREYKGDSWVMIRRNGISFMFMYTDSHVAWPIAAKYDRFPFKQSGGGEFPTHRGCTTHRNSRSLWL